MKKDIVEKLFDELSAQSNTYITIIGIILAVFSILMVVFGYQQHKFSDNGIKKMKEDFKGDFKEEFRKDFKINEIGGALAEIQLKSNQIDKILNDVQSKSKEMNNLVKNAKQEIQDTRNSDLEGKAQLLEYTDVSNVISALNGINTLRRSLNMIIESNELTQVTLKEIFVCVGNCLSKIRDSEFYENEEYKKAVTALVNQLNKEFVNIDEKKRIDGIKKHYDYMNKKYKQLEDSKSQD